MLCYSIFVLTFEMTFINTSNIFYQISEIITTCIFFLDLFVNFNSAYYNNSGKLIISRRNIVIKYLKGWFFLDFIATFPFFLFTQIKAVYVTKIIKSSKLLKIINLARLIRMFKIIKQMFNQDYKKKTQKNFFNFKNSSERLIIQIIISAIFCHLYSCIFYIVPVTFNPNQNWVVERGLKDASPFHLYLMSLHWMIETMVTVGFGENPIK